MVALQSESSLELASFLLPEQSTPSRGKVLVVDDESRIRLALRGCLEAEGYDVEEARDGAEAIRTILDTHPDVMLLDLAMPRLDGLSTLREIHARYRDVMPKTVVLTAWGAPSVKEETFLLGVSAFLNKPLVPAVLRDTIDRILSQPPTKEGDRDDDSDDPEGPFGLYLG